MSCLGRLLTFLTLAVLCVLPHGGKCQINIEHYFAGPNTIYDIDYRDGTLAIGTNAGLIVVQNGKSITFTKDDGLPDNGVKGVVLADRDTLFIGPFGGRRGQRLYRAEIRGDQLEATDITPEQPFDWNDGMLAVGPDGSFWVGDMFGLSRYDGVAWEMHEWPAPFSKVLEGGIRIDESGTIWGVAREAEYVLFRFDGGEWTVFDHVEMASGIGVDEYGGIWSITSEPPGLWRLSDDSWEMVSYDSVWKYHHDIQFDEEGAIWSIHLRDLLRWQDQTFTKFTGAFGINFSALNGPITCMKVLSSSSVLVGTCGYGLLVFDGHDFSRIFEDGLPDDYITAVAFDSDGRPWLSASSFLMGVFQEGRWETICAPWTQGWQPSRCVMDLDGSEWFVANTGAMRLVDGELQAYDVSNSSLKGAFFVAIDSQGTKWFSQEWYPEDGVVSFDNETWRSFSSDDYFDSELVCSVTIGPQDTLWFEPWGGTSRWTGYKMFDGEQWHHFRYGTELTPTCLSFPGMRPIVFDAHGSAFLYGYGGAYKGYPGDDWDYIHDEDTMALMADSEDTIWLGTENGLVYGQPGAWTCISDRLTHASVTTIAIDHNGDKWVGTAYGLNRIEDGGPAQQKLELAVEASPDGGISVSGTLTNAGAVIPVLLWLACEYDGTLYYYPAWGPIPEGTKRVLGAYSIESEELLRLDTSTLPPGDYTFYGGISLLGGMDLLIGARGAKIAIATYWKE